MGLTEVTEFEHKSHGANFHSARRYYFRLTSNDAGQRYGSGMQVTSSASDILIHHPVPMRSKPTALETSGTASDYAVARTSTWEVCNVVPVLQVAHTHSTMVRTNQTQSHSLSTGIATILRANTTDFVLGFTAELLTMKYKEYKTENAIKTEGKKIYLRIEDDGSQSISCNEDNEDFKAWVAEGNTPEKPTRQFIN